MNRKNWSDDEDMFIKENYTRMRVAGMGTMLNRSENSIRNRIYHLGLKLGDVKNSYKGWYKWCGEDDRILLNNHDVEMDEICKLLPHRTRAAINVRRGVLGVRNGYREDIIMNTRGYVMEWDYGLDKRVPQHRLVMEFSIKRKLNDCEIVHHINGKKDDNRIENLYLCKNVSEHRDIHNSITRLMYEMISNGTVIFDEGMGEYKIMD